MMEGKRGLVLGDRDFLILNEVSRFKYILGRQIKILTGFTGERSCDRRLKRLIDYSYLERKHILYGIPSLYFLGKNAKNIGTIRYYSYKLKLDEIVHNIAVIDTVIFLMETLGLSLSDFESERELHSKDGFSNRKHQPDTVFKKDGKRIAVEVEFTPKSKTRFMNNIRSNFSNFDGQFWIVPKSATKVRQLIIEASYPDTTVIDWEEVSKHVRKN